MNANLTTTMIADMLGVSSQTIANWIDQGRLKASRTPGGHRRVARQDLMAFLAAQSLPIPDELADRDHTVLIVEDDPQLGPWLLSQVALVRPDLRLLLAQDGFAAGELVARECPGVIILDVYLPGQDGFEVCRRIKANPRTAGATVIAVTGHTSSDVHEAIVDAGAETCLTKPVELPTLIALVDDALPAPV